MPSKKISEHIRINLEFNAFLCAHCKTKMTISLPVSVEMFSVITKQFVREHRWC